MNPIELLDAEALWHTFLSWIPRIVAAGLILLVTWLAARIARRAAESVVRRIALDLTAASFLQMVLKTIIITIGVIAALGHLGVNTASIVTSLGVAGLTIGFAAKDALSNMISGLFIFWDRPFVIGDLVEIDGKYGRVDAITMRSTRVVTPDGRMLAVPNSIVVNSTVASYTNFPHLRVEVPFTVGVNEDLGRVRALAIEVAGALTDGLAGRTPEVQVTTLGDYNIGLVVQVWIGDERNHLAARAVLTEALYERLRAEGVDMPYQTIALAPVELRGAAPPG